MTNGWYELFTGDMFLWYANLSVPRRLIIRPLDHSEVESNGDDLNVGAEVHRWFDYWLKGIDNGSMDEPPINYYTLGASAEQAWQSTDTWPVPDLEQPRFYFDGGESGSSSGSKDGILSMEAPVSLDAHDSHKVDYSATSGEHTLWGAVLSGSEYPNLRTNDEKALTYTTAPLERTVGSPDTPWLIYGCLQRLPIWTSSFTWRKWMERAIRPTSPRVIYAPPTAHWPPRPAKRSVCLITRITSATFNPLLLENRLRWSSI